METNITPYVSKRIKRRFQRFEVPATDLFNLNIQYKGDRVSCTLSDISIGGASVIAFGLPFSMIDNTVVKIDFDTGLKNFRLYARVVYSYKCAGFFSRRYGLEFLGEKSPNLALLIRMYC